MARGSTSLRLPSIYIAPGGLPLRPARLSPGRGGLVFPVAEYLMAMDRLIETDSCIDFAGNTPATHEVVAGPIPAATLLVLVVPKFVCWLLLFQ